MDNFNSRTRRMMSIVQNRQENSFKADEPDSDIITDDVLLEQCDVFLNSIERNPSVLQSEKPEIHNLHENIPEVFLGN